MESFADLASIKHCQLNLDLIRRVIFGTRQLAKQNMNKPPLEVLIDVSNYARGCVRCNTPL
jgi:hypothetical protein